MKKYFLLAIITTLNLTSSYVNGQPDKDLVKAVSKCKFEAVVKALNKGANVEAKNDYGRTVLMMSAALGSINTVQLLIEKGANVNEQDNGYTALHAAVANEHAEIVQLLIQKGADVMKIVKNDGKSALRYAIDDGNIAIIKMLLSEYIKLNQKIDDFDMLSKLAANERKYEIVRFL